MLQSNASRREPDRIGVLAHHFVAQTDRDVLPLDTNVHPSPRAKGLRRCVLINLLAFDDAGGGKGIIVRGDVDFVAIGCRIFRLQGRAHKDAAIGLFVGIELERQFVILPTGRRAQETLFAAIDNDRCRLRYASSRRR